jgi:UDP-N-acetylmuramoylalanine--D-glutamate ligase
MRNAEYFKGKKVTIIGLARSGVACANLLNRLGALVSVTDVCDNEKTQNNRAQLVSTDIECELGRHSQEFIKGRDMVVISPGVGEDSQAVIWARRNKVPVVSEIEVAWRLCPATVIAVTGSNGKTTVTTLIGKILESSGKRTFVCGNIGDPFSAEVANMKDDDFVALEVSSFQLENISFFKPKISLILNFSRNHLDRYKDMQEYLEAKKKVFINQDGFDYLLLNADDPVLKELASLAKAKVILFSKGNGMNPNQAAVLQVGEILGISPDACRKVFRDFKGIEHRLEYVGQVNQVKFINDSKATTVESCMLALETIPNPVILIAGGRHKGVDYNIMLDLARRKVKLAVLIGEARKNIKEVFSGNLPFEEALTMEEALAKAFYAAKPGDCILLSPMCSSYDMFTDYEHRGRVFKDEVNRLISKNAGKFD